MAELHRTQELVLSSEIPRGCSQSGCPASLWGATRSPCAGSATAGPRPCSGLTPATASRGAAGLGGQEGT